MAGRRKNEIKWSKKKYNLKKFTKAYQLPQIVNVISGWCGADEHETISSGQILRVGRKFTQQRVVAEDDMGRHISMPVNYRFKFNVLPASDDNRAYTIEEILSTFTLPQKIQLAKEEGMFVSVDGAQRQDYSFGLLNLLRRHEISYLVCNSMNAGGIVKQPLTLPMYITIEVAVAEGLITGNKKQWEDYQRVRTQMVENYVDSEKVTGNEDISIYGSAEVSVKRKANVTEHINIYEEIEPKIVRISTVRNKGEKEANEKEGLAATAPYEDVIELPNTSTPAPPDSLPQETYTPLVNEMKAKYEKITRKTVASRPVPTTCDVAYDVVEPSDVACPPLPPKPSKSMTLPYGSRLIQPPSSDQHKKQRAFPPQPIGPKPAIKPKAAEARVVPVQHDGKKEETKFPDDVRGLSVDKVCDCLRALNLGQYANDFKENDVDGEFLTELTEDIMRNELGMTELHSKKLFKFVNGWRPNYNK